MTSPLVVTSLDPGTRLAHQKRCLTAWHNLGLETCSFNAAEQVAAVEACNIPGLRVTEAEDAGEEGPFVLSLLKHIHAAYPGRTVILTRSDIFAAVKSPDFINALLEDHGAVALTHEDAAIVQGYRFGDRASCHSRIDTFVLRPDRLSMVIEQLSRWHVCSRMQMHGFGWAYALTAVIASSATGGHILDSAVLIHERHDTHEETAAEAVPFMEMLIETGLLQAADPDTVVAKFEGAVQAACRDNAAVSRRVKALYFQAPAVLGSPQAQAVALRVQASAPWASWNYCFRTLSALADRVFAGEGFSFAHLNAVFTTGPSQHHQFAERLLSIFFYLTCVQHGLGRQPLTDDYPADLSHGARLSALMARTRDDAVARRLGLADLFGTSLVDHSVYNARLFDALILSCQNDDERHLLQSIHTATKGLFDAAA